MAVQTQTIDYSDQDTALQGFFAFDDAQPGPVPAVVIAHAWGGRDEFVCDKAEAIAKLGYAGFALDMYGKGILGSGPEENAKLMQPFLEDRAVLQQRMQRALDVVRERPEVDGSKVAAMGYCFGGLCALDLARTGADILGAISFHGLFGPPGNTSGTKIKAKILALHGHDDPMVPVDSVVALETELTEAGADWQIHVYGHTTHAFTNPKANDPGFGTVYHPQADKRAWRSLQNFLEEIFQ